MSTFVPNISSGIKISLFITYHLVSKAVFGHAPLYFYLENIFVSLSISDRTNQSKKIKISPLKNRQVKIWTSGSTGWSTPGGTVSSTHRNGVTFPFSCTPVSDYAHACIVYRKAQICKHIYNNESMCMQIVNVCTLENCHCKSAPVGLLKRTLGLCGGVC